MIQIIGQVFLRIGRYAQLYAIGLFFLSVCCPMTYAQQSSFQYLDLSSPNASSMEKYGEIPISYHTGVPQIDVPLMGIKEGVLQLPISLSYHASGLQVMETASWVGAGWTLMAGGAITRSVQGLPDEKQSLSQGFSQQRGYYDDLGFSDYVNNNRGTAEDAYALNVGTGIVDAEPDRYQINVPGFSAKFYFNDDQSVVFEQASDAKVVPYKGNDGGFAYWEVILASGIRYTFGQQHEENGPIVERSYAFQQEISSVNYRAAVSSWLLTEISSADGEDVISFHYADEEYGYHSLVPSANSQGSTPALVKYSLRGWRLTQIRYTHGKVIFRANSLREDLSDFSLQDANDDANTEAYALNEIEWQDNDNTCYRKFVLSTSYFDNQTAPAYGSPAVSTDRKRLKLDQVQEIGCGSASKPPYVFTYYQPAEVPRRLSYAQDHWGFFNGETQNTGLLPNGDNPNLGPQRESQFPAMQAGTLQQMQYPTGGITSFEYEANQVWRQYTEDVIAATPEQLYNTTGAGSNATPDRTVTLNGRYQVVAECRSSGEDLLYVRLRQGNTNAFRRDIEANTEPQSEILDLSGSYTLEMNVNRSFSTGTVRFFPVTTENRDQDFTVGGLRIARVTRSPGGDGEDVVRTYEYTKNNVFGGALSQISSAALYGRPVYRSYIRNDYLKTVGSRDASGNLFNNDPEGCLDGGNPNSATLTSIFGVFPKEEVQGYHLG